MSRFSQSPRLSAPARQIEAHAGMASNLTRAADRLPVFKSLPPVSSSADDPDEAPFERTDALFRSIHATMHDNVTRPFIVFTAFPTLWRYVAVEYAARASAASSEGLEVTRKRLVAVRTLTQLHNQATAILIDLARQHGIDHRAILDSAMACQRAFEPMPIFGSVDELPEDALRWPDCVLLGHVKVSVKARRRIKEADTALHALWRVVGADAKEDEQPSIEAKTATARPVRRPPPVQRSAVRLAVDVDRCTITVDGSDLKIASTQAVRWAKVLLEHPGEWITPAGLEEYDIELSGARIDRLRRHLPPQVLKMIESVPRKGSRMRLEPMA